MQSSWMKSSLAQMYRELASQPSKERRNQGLSSRGPSSERVPSQPWDIAGVPVFELVSGPGYERRCLDGGGEGQQRSFKAAVCGRHHAVPSGAGQHHCA